jgi:hypothetical protein
MAKNDVRIKRSFENKTRGGYISIEPDVNDDNDDEENKDIEFKYNLIYNSLGVLQNGQNIWIEKLNSLVQYIDENNKRPSCHSKDDETRKLGQWVDRQVQNYKKKKEIMKNEEIYNKWTEFINDPKYKEYL